MPRDCPPSSQAERYSDSEQSWRWHDRSFLAAAFLANDEYFTGNILTAKQGVDRQQIMKVMPAEIRATVKLYLDGEIHQWYSRGDGRGVIFVLGVKSVNEAHAIIDTLPLSKENLMDHEYIPVGPLLPLAGLIGAGPAQH